MAVLLSPLLAGFASPEASHSAYPRRGSPVWPPAWTDTRERKQRAGEGREAASWFLPSSELGGAAGVALQQAHDRRVAFGPTNELLQRQLACGAKGGLSVRRRQLQSQAGGGRRCGRGKKGGRPPPTLTVIVCVHLAEDFLSPLFRGRFVLGHLHHGRNHLVNGLWDWVRE